jgi:hypothetical protein
VERVCNRLKRRLPIAPLLVKRTDQIAGRTSLRTLGVRVFTVTACVLRRSLEQAQATRPGLPPETTRKMTDTPTAERRLQAFVGVALPIRQSAAGERKSSGGLRPCQGCREPSCHGWGWVLISTASLQCRI